MQIIVWGVWLWILVLIAKQDRRTRTIPDRLTACLMAAGLLSALWTPQPGMVQRLAGALAVSVPMFVLNMVFLLSSPALMPEILLFQAPDP